MPKHKVPRRASRRPLRIHLREDIRREEERRLVVPRAARHQPERLKSQILIQDNLDDGAPVESKVVPASNEGFGKAGGDTRGGTDTRCSSNTHAARETADDCSGCSAARACNSDIFAFLARFGFDRGLAFSYPGVGISQ
jgi:hypothetical protein